MKVYIVRHAETNYNVLRLCNDSPSVDVHLTGNGIAQAKKLAETLRSISFQHIITSEFPRTKQTATILDEGRGIKTSEDSRINDVLTGFEGKPVREFKAARSNASDPLTAKFNDGESLQDEKLRVQSFLDDLKQRHENSILIVTHQAIARLIYANIHNLPDKKVDDVEVPNTHYFEFEL